MKVEWTQIYRSFLLYDIYIGWKISKQQIFDTFNVDKIWVLSCTENIYNPHVWNISIDTSDYNDSPSWGALYCGYVS